MLVMPPGAKRISSGMTSWYKRGFPLFFLAIPVLVLVMMASGNWGPSGMPSEVYIGPGMVVVIGFIVFKLLLSNLIDEVWDNGHELIVVNEDHVEHVPLASIVNINYSGLTNPKLAYLLLRQPGRWGRKLKFIPVRSKMFFNLTHNETIDDLIERVDQARRGA